MKIKLERIEGEGPRMFNVLLVEDDGEGPSTDVGVVAHIAGSEWEFAPKGNGPAQDTQFKITLQAETEEELHAAFRQRFGVAELQADRLRTETMEGFTTEVYLLLNVLASRTGSTAGHAAALAHAVAMVMTEDTKDPEEFRRKFIEQVDTQAASMRAKAAMENQMRDAMRDLIGTMTRGRSGDPTKH